MISLNKSRKFSYIKLENVTSTQDEALKLFNYMGGGNFIVTAKLLTKGRGRTGNIWVAPPGNLNFSMLLSGHLENVVDYYLPFILSQALYDVLAPLINNGKKISIKWPNDILIDNKKVAGILIETAINPKTNKFNYVIIGIGVNIRDVPIVEGRELTCVCANSSLVVKAEDLVEPLKEAIVRQLDNFAGEGFDVLKKRWLECAVSVGQEITTTYDGKKISGKFEDLGEKGEILLRLEDGSIQKISSGIIE